MNIAKFLREPIMKNTCERLLLYICKMLHIIYNKISHIQILTNHLIPYLLASFHKKHRWMYSARLIEAVVRWCSVKKAFLKISQNSQENTCARVRPATLLKNRLWHSCFPENFAKFLRTPFLIENLRWLLLHFRIS